MKLHFMVMVFQQIYASIGGGGGVNLPEVYMHFAIYIRNLFGVIVFQRSMLD